MMSEPWMPIVEISAPWESTVSMSSPSAIRLLVRDENGSEADVRLERCALGRLRSAYPVGAHDIEIQLVHADLTMSLAALLRKLVSAVRAADSGCRRIVFADRAGVGRSVEEAGFHSVVEVDVEGDPLNLFVMEPDWVTAVDIDLDRVPGT